MTWKGAPSNHGIGNCNDNGRLLFEFFTECQHAITNTIFQQKDRLNTTWMHPWSKHWNPLDYVHIRLRDLKNVLYMRVLPIAKCCTNHIFVRCKIKLQFKASHKKKGNYVKKLNVGSLLREDVKAKFQADLLQNLIISPCKDVPTPDTLWDNLMSAILKTSADVFRHTKKKIGIGLMKMKKKFQTC